MGKNSERLNLKVSFEEKVDRVIIKNSLRKVLTPREILLIYYTKYTLFNNLYAEVIVNYKLDKI